MIKILTILGARPQFIKASSVSREILKNKDIKEIIIHTGQHYDNNMSEVFFDEMKIPKPDYFLGIGGSSHGSMTGQMIEKIEEVVLLEKPDWILVYGDTNSTLAGAIVASKLNIKLAHVEAGLRSFNMKMPEEVNRILTDRVSNLLFCPTTAAVLNLEKEGYLNFKCKIIKSGDVMRDGAIYYKEYAKKPTCLINDNYVLVTIHRAENTNDINRLKSILEALKEISNNIQVILPLHPRTKKVIQEQKYNIGNITILEPVGYLEMIWLIDNCELVMTESGGLQKEAYFFKKNCITLRDETEWIELIENNYNILVGSNYNKIIKTYSEYLFNPNFDSNLYGSNASELIINEILKYSLVKY